MKKFFLLFLLPTVVLNAAQERCQPDESDIPASILDEQVDKQIEKKGFTTFRASTLWQQRLSQNPQATIYQPQEDGWILLSHYFISRDARKADHVQIEVDYEEQFKVDFNKADKGGVTPLMIASFKLYNSYRPLDPLVSLLKLKADPNARDNKGRTALDHACAAEKLLQPYKHGYLVVEKPLKPLEKGFLKEESPLIATLGLGPKERHHAGELLQVIEQKKEILQKAMNQAKR